MIPGNNPIKSIVNNIIEFIAPSQCLVCGKYIGEIEHELIHICDNCVDDIDLADEPELIYNSLIENSREEKLPIDSIVCLLNFKARDSYKDMIHYLKYSSIPSIGEDLGILLYRRMQQYGFSKADCIIPIPVHHARKRERGYNQAYFIAKGISKVSGIPINDTSVKRNKYTGTQTALIKSQRKSNVSGVFSVKKVENIKDKSVILVDDVLTTGSTLISCAGVIKNSGASKIIAAVAAKA